MNNQTAILESAQDELQLKIASLMSNTGDWIYFKDRNSVFTLVSDSMVERLTGSRENSVIGMSDADFLDADCARMIIEDDRRIMQTGSPIHGKVEQIVHESGEIQWVSTSKMPLTDSDGAIVGLMGISRNITQRKQVEQELEKTNSELMTASRRAGMAEVATNVIHNVGNVLNSVNVSNARARSVASNMEFAKLEKLSELLADNVGDPDFHSRDGKGSLIPNFLGQLTKSLQEMNETLLAELESTRQHLEHVCCIISRQQQYATHCNVFEKVELSDLVDNALQMSMSAIESNGITVVRDFEPGVQTETDKHRVLEIVVNLIRNAKHACADSGYRDRKISITTRSFGEDGCQIIVADNGVGIEPEHLVKIFTHGFTTRSNGHGFGLHGGANAAKQLGGSLIAKSEGPGKGATFTLTLPGPPADIDPETNKQATANDA